MTIARHRCIVDDCAASMQVGRLRSIDASWIIAQHRCIAETTP
jgi:hypothetical protein